MSSREGFFIFFSRSFTFDTQKSNLEKQYLVVAGFRMGLIM